MLNNMLDFFKNLFANKKFLVIIFLTILFVVIAYFTYRKYVLPRLESKYVANEEFVKKDAPEETMGDVTLYFFYTTWCPHCKTAKPEWQSLKDEVSVVNGRRIIYKEVDCDEDSDLASKFKVEGYPTIKLVTDDKVIDYDAKPDKNTLMQFLESSIV